MDFLSKKPLIKAEKNWAGTSSKNDASHAARGEAAVDWPLWILTVLSAVTRFWRLGYPNVVVFDELFYSRFVHMYVNGIFFFDSNPPFAKQLIAGAAYLANYSAQNETFAKIGDAYSPETPIWVLRFIPCLFGTLLVPLSYCIVRNLGYSQLAATISGVCFLLDGALITGSRFVMTDSVNLALLLSSLFCILRFVQSRPLSGSSVLWGLLVGLFMGLAISTKYVSFPSLLWFTWIIFRHYWKVLDDLSISAKRLVEYFIYCVLIVIFVPVAVYVGSFLIHLTVITKAGPYDTMMSTRFQASLEGGLAAISRGQPYNVAYGSQITLRNHAGVQDNACWLHSHKEVYPLRYDDGRGSSHQQQVTCYSFKDVNNWWIIKHPNKTILEVESPPEHVRDGAVVQLVHGVTGRLLNSHDVAAPISPECQEVSCYIDYNITMPAEELWEVKIINQEAEDRYWHAIQTNVQLIHVNSKTTLSISGQQLPPWAFNQFEVVSSVQLSKFTLSLWTVEEHRYSTAHSGQKEREAALLKDEFIPDKATDLSLWKKFWELQWSMLGLSRDTVEEHVYGSKPFDWIMNDNGVAFWAQKGSNRQIYQLGNVVVWHTGACALLVTVVALSLVVLVRMRFPEIFPNHHIQWIRVCFAAEVALGGFVVNWLPYFFTDRTLFFHHYYPALGFKFLLLGGFMGEIMDLCRNKEYLAKTVQALVAVWIMSVIYTFVRFVPITYGFDELSASELHGLEWRESWNFIIRNS
ncbi:protein O-mannosyltransferase 1-like [Paramacrobiotus metropolitanus]|uniref:protein O-mannosyltransferase 1-like n=1 Tax=Paramacrobiotus metropolitanus TaxID=2943436 RepID=UPI002445A24F|nr:protein O-mannosyltransferase 1-like [Paramacrobiotus metropolitanus]XP_055353920.1 protein O-mannosyltransferase 1-like [Paramacrobiotus metropolitanus]XP_055353926.1 protein O-mannosyltransferase 1-like [Paramacrobiotus metropolitanus]XP_055353934.1 protein O-mannosyltransferase 1-like [Paramacrobiotus metropolitanus]XP_055353941.1 protein O-mannosyltransferase 1-like [Paramacrobiotus metropolitanus]XP_055353951.1 protein O-mannosyltransferase 1-like [Paramacrobiotus metropolitanus]